MKFPIKSILIFTTISCLLLGLESCHTNRRNLIRTEHGKEEIKRDRELQSEAEHKLKGEEKRVIEEAFEWLGTAYEYGKQEKGISTDCSGMVMEVFLTALGCKLPRNSAKQAEFCDKITNNRIKPGDLVFFITNNGNKINHVGIMIDEVNFLHASSKGVVVSSMHSDYYKRHFIKYGRVPCLHH